MHSRVPHGAVMKKLVIAFAVYGLIGTPAFAADLSKPVYKAPPPPAPVSSWTGWYVGGNVGYSWGANSDLVGSGDLSYFASRARPFALADSNIAPNGVIGGGQIGYNYQFSRNGVLGFEADFQGSGDRGSGQLTDTSVTTQLVAGGGVPPLQVSATAMTNYEARIDWFGTARGRLGMLFGDQLLIYGTGGLAYGRVAASGNTNLILGSANGCLFACTTPLTPVSVSRTNVGFAVGAGMEGKFLLPSNWTWKLEWLYLDLGSVDTTASFNNPAMILTFAPYLADATIATHTHFTDNILRIGVNYQFH
jgi:outer membrane immunogenic protein